MYFRAFRAVRRWEMQISYATPYSVACLVFVIVIPSIPILASAWLFEQNYYRPSAEIFFSLLFGSWIAMFIVLWRVDK
ncbi:MAG: hypothetical protein AAF871_12655 [Pseudomonadota bacterium]